MPRPNCGSGSGECRVNRKYGEIHVGVKKNKSKVGVKKSIFQVDMNNNRKYNKHMLKYI